MKYLVTGGAGFIGSNLVEMLLADGHEVIVLDDLSSGYEENLFAEADFIAGDITDPEVVHEAATGVDSIFHLAASVGNTRSIDDPFRAAEVNYTGTLRVLEAARKHCIEHLVCRHIRAIKTLPIAEDHPFGPLIPPLE